VITGVSYGSWPILEKLDNAMDVGDPAGDQRGCVAFAFGEKSQEIDHVVGGYDLNLIGI
jgi:hypothetical protein